MWYVYAMEFYAAKTKTEIMRFAGKLLELEITVLNEISQAQKDKCFIFFSDQVEPRLKYLMHTHVYLYVFMCIYLYMWGLGHGLRQGIMREEEELLREARNRVMALIQ